MRGRTSSVEYVSDIRSENSVSTSYGVARPPYTTRSEIRLASRRSGQNASPTVMPANSVISGESATGPTTAAPTNASAASANAVMSTTTMAPTTVLRTTTSRSHRRYRSSAIPMAPGTPQSTAANKTNHAASLTKVVSFGPSPIEVTKAATTATSERAATDASQRSCCRSSPREARNRTITITTESRLSTSVPIPPIAKIALAAPVIDGIPVGFCGWTPGFTSIGPAFRIDPMASRANPMISAGGNQRQRREGIRPVGKTARSIGIGKSAAKNPRLSPMSAASTTNLGSDPGDVRSP
jgi:hypothetical protein